jgi:hypothetical protein
MFPQEGNGELVVRDLATGKERRESLGPCHPRPIRRMQRIRRKEKGILYVDREAGKDRFRMATDR